MRDYKVISADSHVIEPHDLWQQYIDPKFRERAPRLVRGDDNDVIVCDQAEMPPVGLLAGCARSDDQVRAEGRWDEDVFRGGYDPEARLDDLARDGVDAEILFPTLAMQMYPIPDSDFQWALFRAYNTWLADFCRAHPDRYKGIGILLHEDVDRAIEELTYCKDLGHVGVMVPMYAGEDNPYHDPAFDRLWAAAVEADMPVNPHTSTTRVKSKAWNRGTAANWVTKVVQVQDVILNAIFFGLFDRFPGLRLVSAENDAGWAGNLLERADYWWQRNRRVYSGGQDVVCERRPSEYFHENVRLTFMRDRTAIHAHEIIGAGTLMWGSDFPHHVSTWPQSQTVLDEHFDDTTEHLREQVVCTNVRELYRF